MLSLNSGLLHSLYALSYSLVFALIACVFFLHSTEAEEALWSCRDTTTLSVAVVVCGTEKPYNYPESTYQWIYHGTTLEKALMFSLHQYCG